MKKSQEKDELKKQLSQVRKEFETMKSKLSKITSYLNIIAVNYNKTVDKHEKILEKIASTNQNVEDTLLNVLLAIRQNEYLQAWYPPQHGFPEMKVTGTHPAKLKKA